MFSPLILNAWEAGTLVALVSGVVGVFTVLRGSAFAAHGIPASAFAGAAGAGLIGASPLGGLVSFAIGGALLVTWLGQKVRADVATALTVVLLLALGDLFLSRSNDYGQTLYAGLFGSIFSVSSDDLVGLAVIGAISLIFVLALCRPLLLSAVAPDLASARGVNATGLDAMFLVALALATAVAVPVVGALLVFSMIVAPAAIATTVAPSPRASILLSVIVALLTMWGSIALSYLSNLPVGFFLGVIGAVGYACARVLNWSASRHFGTATARADVRQTKGSEG